MPHSPEPMGPVTLRVPGGDAHTYPISFGNQRFEPYRADHTNPDSIWLVDVPAHIAASLLHNAGFSMVESNPNRQLSGNIIRLRHADGTGCGWDGIAYEPDMRGVVEVPAEAAADLASHGFQPAPDLIVAHPEDDGTLSVTLSKEFVEAVQRVEAIADVVILDHDEPKPYRGKR